MSLIKGQKHDLQIMQNGVLRFAKIVCFNDRISRMDLLKDTTLSSN